MALRVDVGIDAQRDPGAGLPRRRERVDPLDLARSDSALIVITPRSIACASSACVLPTPVKTICAGMKPARSATSISPPELASAPAPRLRSSRAIASVELALSA